MIIRQNKDISAINLSQMQLLTEIGLKQEFNRSFVNAVVSDLTPLLEADTQVARNCVRKARLAWTRIKRE